MARYKCSHKMQIISGFFAVLMAGCTATQAPTPQIAANPEPRGVSVTPANFRLPEGSGCQGDIARFRAIQANDLETGHVTQPVYNQIEVEMKTAAQLCANGNSGGASAHVRMTKSRFGYP